ncbi:GcrA cell cycle regulator [Methylobacterium phyllostachyos]|uniref:GcrA cell cycle regulator n=1 Tax=Methylobacterium phyllostachyos TaxID=582672 RepID=A0A1G9UAE8_9HYPH|nr:hypothetical protein [Methylobacterium phyllostachyos]SDM56901.1 GcrA cell cycle regulator [Methylobacterium phyllostachyos]
MPWLPAHRALVLEMWPTGCGTPVIRAALLDLGIEKSKSSIISIAFRAGLAFQGARHRKAPSQPKRIPMTPEERAEKERARAARRRERSAVAAGRPVPPPRPRVQPADVPVSLGVPIWEIRDGGCRFIADDPKAGGTCCGHQTVPGSSWCPGHRAICAAPAQRPVSVWVPGQRRVA